MRNLCRKIMGCLPVLAITSAGLSALAQTAVPPPQPTATPSVAANQPATSNQPVAANQPAAATPQVSEVPLCVDSPKDPRTKTCDEREDLSVTLFLGLGIDSFAASDLKNVLNPEASSDIQERVVAGFDFQYRIKRFKATERTGEDPKQFLNREAILGAQQLWLYGETVHGVRSTDINCTETPNLPACTTNGNPFDPTTAGDQVIYILRNASSLESFAGLRYEFFPLNFGHKHQASLFVKSEAGFLTIAKSGGDVFDNHQTVAVGAIATAGKLQNSFFQIGYGRSDFFSTKATQRWKVNGYVEWEMRGSVRGFAEMYADMDIGHGADSVQTYLGIIVDLGSLFGGNK